MKDFIPIQGYEQYYGINEQGEIYSTYYGLILKPGLSAGYPRVTLYKPGKKPKGLHLHRLLAQHFIKNPFNLSQVNHKDGDRCNYSLDNLEWCTPSENIQHAYNVLGKTNGWGASRQKINRDKTCEYCKGVFQYKKKQQRFCNNSCAAKSYQPIKLFKQGILTK